MTNGKEHGSEDNSDAELKKILNRVLDIFFIEPGGEDLLSTYSEGTREIKAPFDEISAAFRSNIEGLVWTISIPYLLAHSASMDRHYQLIAASERIRALKLDREGEENQAALDSRRDAVARDIANKRMDEFVHSAEGRKVLIGDLSSFLLRSVDKGSLSHAASELVLQGLVLCWGAFEVLSRDSFVALLNRYPRLAEVLLKDPAAKRRFEIAKLPLETLAAHDFNLSSKMGTLLADDQDLSDLLSIKAVFEALFPKDANIRSALANEDLRVLSQRRHSVVHRRGLIDVYYKTAVASCTQNIGEKLRVSPNELKTHIQTSATAAVAILVAANALVTSEPGHPA